MKANVSWTRAATIVLGLAGGGALWPGASSALAQTSISQPAATTVLPLDRALDLTARTGRPAVVVVTARSQPSSVALWDSLSRLVGSLTIGRSFSFAEMSQETYPDAVRRLGVKSFPTVVVYRRSAKGLEIVGHQVAPKDAAYVIGWLGALDISRSTARTAPAHTSDMKVDPEVVQTDHFHHAQPTPQGAPQIPTYATQAPAPAVPQTLVPLASSLQPQGVPYVSGPASTPMVVSGGSQTVLFQQPAMNIVVAPAPPPSITFTTAAPSTPTVSLLQGTSAVASSPTQLFLQPAAAAAPAAMMAAPAPAAAMTYAAAAPAAMVPVAAAAPAQTATVEAIPAGPIGRMLGRVGEKLVKHGYPRVRATTATTTTMQVQGVAAPVQQAAQVAGVPVSVVPQASYAPQGQANVQGAPAPPPVAPSPQYGSGQSGHGLFHHH